MKAWCGIKVGIVCLTVAVCVAGILIRPAAPRRVAEPAPAELYRVVLQELEAVRQADYVSAYRNVSVSMQERYNLDVFSEVVRTDHPELARFDRVEFGAIRSQGRQAMVPAYLFLPNGDIAAVTYSLIREEGTWRIDSSRVQRHWSQGYRVSGTRL
jgi:hypothetical protein